MGSWAPYKTNFVNPDPYSWLASSGEFAAQDVFGPPANTLEAASLGYPGTSAQAAAIKGQGRGGGMHWYQDRAWHSLFWLAGGWFLFHQYLKAD